MNGIVESNKFNDKNNFNDKFKYEDKFKEECGVFGIFSPDKNLDVASLTYYGLVCLAA